MADARAAESGTAERYGATAIAIHWLVAALVAAVVALGLLIPEAPRGSHQRAMILMLHRSIGVTILAAMVFRGLWRIFHPAPLLPASLGRMEAALAHATAAALYLVLLGMPVLGYLDAAAAGHPLRLFGLVTIPPLIGENDRLSQIAIALHLVGQYLVYGLVALHVAAALMHGLVRRDGVLSRMLPARRSRRGPL